MFFRLTYNDDEFDLFLFLGKRFAIVEIKVIMARLLERYWFELSPMNGDKLEIDPWSLIVSSKNGLWVKIHKLIDVK